MPKIINQLPTRMQWHRNRDGALPPDALNIMRPGRWGNHYRMMGDMIYEYAGERRKILSPWVLAIDSPQKDDSLFWELTELYFRGKILSGELNLCQLSGKRLACACTPDKPCHADILIKLYKEFFLL